MRNRNPGQAPGFFLAALQRREFIRGKLALAATGGARRVQFLFNRDYV
jgi:hypothetical protein